VDVSNRTEPHAGPLALIVSLVSGCGHPAPDPGARVDTDTDTDTDTDCPQALVPVENQTSVDLVHFFIGDATDYEYVAAATHPGETLSAGICAGAGLWIEVIDAEDRCAASGTFALAEGESFTWSVERRRFRNQRLVQLRVDEGRTTHARVELLPAVP
jgi:hypothetical protein